MRRLHHFSQNTSERGLVQRRLGQQFLEPDIPRRSFIQTPG
jgi:hypothetical protein